MKHFSEIPWFLMIFPLVLTNYEYQLQDQRESQLNCVIITDIVFLQVIYFQIGSWSSNENIWLIEFMHIGCQTNVIHDVE